MDMNGKLTILGSGSALPTWQNAPASQVLDLCDKSFMIDCGEGAQISLRRMALKTARLYSIFISHLHGDHCFGLIGLISTFGMMHRTQPLHIYAHKDLEKLLRPWLDYHCQDMSFEVIFHAINPRRHAVIYEDRTITVETLPLKHKVPTCGFLFTEHHRRQDAKGEFYIEHTRRYAYVSDTLYTEKIVPLIEGVDVLFHESTYIEQYADRCKPTMHSTARQAATIATMAKVGKLLIGHYSARVDDHELFLNEAQEVFVNTTAVEERQEYPI